MATVEPPRNEEAPLCKCGCGEHVKWGPGKGWFSYCKGHYMRGRPGTRLGMVTPDATRKRQADTARLREAHKRLHRSPTVLYCPPELLPDRLDILKSIGVSVYNTWQYRESRKKLVEGRPCLLCGATEHIHAYHVVPGDDDTLIPLCRRCHPMVHAGPNAKGQLPPLGEQPPLCACGCGLPVYWKRIRGWAEYRKGHGNAKVPAVSQFQDAPLCACGCGEPVGFRNGVGWNKYKRGHGQRVEGAYNERPRREAPLCGCGCGEKVEWKYRSGYPKYIPGHRPIRAGRKPPVGERPPKCLCGCGQETRWQPGHGWSQYLRGHQRRGKPGGMLGKKLTPEQRARSSAAAVRREARKREDLKWPAR